MNNMSTEPRPTYRTHHVARDVMTSTVITARPEMMCEEVTQLLLTHKISGVPVVDDSGCLMGVISLFDIANANFNWADTNTYFERTAIDRLLAEEGFHLETISTGYVSDYMSPEVFTATPDTPIAILADMMAQHHIHRIIILAPESRVPVGIVTTFDLLRLAARHYVPSAEEKETYPETSICWYMY